MPDPPSSPEFTNSPSKRFSGPARSSNGLSHSRVRSLKPYSRPTSVVVSTTNGGVSDANTSRSNGMTRSDSESSLLLGGLKSVFKWFSGGSSTASAPSPSKANAGATSSSSAASTPKRERESSDASPEKKRLKRSTVGGGGDVFKKPASAATATLYSSNLSGGYLDPPAPSEKKSRVGGGDGLTRSSTERGSLNTRLITGSTSSVGLGGMKRSGTLLDLSSGRPPAAQSPRASAGAASPAPSNAWSPWKQQREEQERRLRSGSSRAGSAMIASPARQLRSHSRMQEDERVSTRFGRVSQLHELTQVARPVFASSSFRSHWAFPTLHHSPSLDLARW